MSQKTAARGLFCATSLRLGVVQRSDATPETGRFPPGLVAKSVRVCAAEIAVRLIAM
jgi:hypothetical protein